MASMLWRGAVLLLVAAGLAQYALVQRAHEVATRLREHLVPQGELRYGRLWPQLWGTGRVWDLSFQPEGLLRLSLQTPEGFRLRVDELEVRELRRDPAGGIEFLSGRLHGLRVPVFGQYAEIVERSDRPPTGFDPGYHELRLDADFSARYVEEAGLALLRIDARAAGLGQLRLRAQLEGTPQVFERAQDRIRLRRLDLEFDDDGLLSRYQSVAAARAQLSLPDWKRATIERLDRRAVAENWGWDAASRESLRRTIDNPERGCVSLRPPGEVFLSRLRLYRAADWAPLLGLRLRRQDCAAP